MGALAQFRGSNKKCVGFNGTDSYIGSVDLGGIITKKMTLVYKLKRNLRTGVRRLCSIDPFSCGFIDDFFFVNNTTSAGTDNNIIYVTVPQDSEIHSFVVVRDMDINVISLYVDGVLSQSRSLINSSNGSITLGMFEIGVNSNLTLSADIYEVQIWNKALTLNEVKHYSKGLGGKEVGLIAYYPMGEGSGDIVHDVVSGNNGNLYGGYIWKDDNTKNVDLVTKGVILEDIGSKLMIPEGVTTNYIRNPLTGIVSWKGDVGLDSNILFKKKPVFYSIGSESGGGFYFNTDNGILQLGAGEEAVSSIWLYNKDVNSMPYFYIIGNTFDGTVWTARDPLSPFITVITEFYSEDGDLIGSTIDWNVWKDKWVLRIDHITNIHTDALRLNRILYFLSYSFTSGTLYCAFPQLERGDKVSPFISGNRLDGSVYLDNFSECPDCLRLYDTTTRISLENPITLPISQGFGFTVDLKIEDKGSDWASVLGSDMGYGGYFGIHGTKQIFWYQDVYNSKYFIWWSGLYVGTDIALDTWVSLGISVTPISATQVNIKLYIDGVIKKDSNFTLSDRPDYTSWIIRFIGGHVNWRYFKGCLSNVAVYNSALNEDRLLKAKNRNVDVKDSGLVGYWRVDEGYGNRLLDLTNNKNNGTLLGVPSWQYSYDGEMLLGSEYIKVKGELIEGVEL